MAWISSWAASSGSCGCGGVLGGARGGASSGRHTGLGGDEPHHILVQDDGVPPHVDDGSKGVVTPVKEGDELRLAKWPQQR